MRLTDCVHDVVVHEVTKCEDLTECGFASSNLKHVFSA
ncbi:hypothetical protein RB2083_2022 [Rhodobacteraceae bacterium HTCC2083]|nr:hypothetical protein RB2083_2022 [Rhodobacteraceae bacterium HTCC2083]